MDRRGASPQGRPQPSLERICPRPGHRGPRRAQSPRKDGLPERRKHPAIGGDPTRILGERQRNRTIRFQTRTGSERTDPGPVRWAIAGRCAGHRQRSPDLGPEHELVPKVVQHECAEGIVGSESRGSERTGSQILPRSGYAVSELANSWSRKSRHRARRQSTRTECPHP
jgi:hypothetical protein